MKLQLQSKDVYGRELIYPICKTALLLAELSGKKTIHKKHLDIIKRLGYEIEWVPKSGDIFK